MDFKNSKSYKSAFSKNSADSFIIVFKKSLGRSPQEYIEGKIKAGSDIESVKYLFNILAAEISNKNKCRFYDFDYFYNQTSIRPMKREPSRYNTPTNAGKLWTKDEEQLLIKMYHENAAKKEMCEKFKRTEVALAARLVKLGAIKEREDFRDKE